MKRDVILEIENMTKVFGSVVALNNVNLTLRKGDVLGLIGENGSGKSTISSIIAGIQKASTLKSMKYKGIEWTPTSMLDALSNCSNSTNGIAMVVQESGTIAGISVAENLFLGELEQFKTKLGSINKKKLNEAAEIALKNIEINNISGSTPLALLDFQSKKLVEIAKVMMRDPDVLIIDETSTALAQDGREILYSIINKFRGTEKAVIFISHDLDEIMEVCDTLTVLRDGNIIRTFEKAEYDPNAIRHAMIGREMKGEYYRSDYEPSRKDEVLLRGENLNLGNSLKNINIDLYKGEILGLGGLSGSGMHELGKVLFGSVHPEKGSVKAKSVAIKSEKIAMANGIGYVSKERDTESLVLSASVKSNISIGGLERFAIKDFLILSNKENEYVEEQIESLSIKCSDRDQIVQTLSGGNKQKVVFGKWIGRGSSILILDCPTRGVDIGVKQAMYQLMIKLKEEGNAILLISEELPELLGMSDRILIMKNGEITKEFERSETLSDADIINYMI